MTFAKRLRTKKLNILQNYIGGRETEEDFDSFEFFFFWVENGVQVQLIDQSHSWSETKLFSGQNAEIVNIANVHN